MSNTWIPHPTFLNGHSVDLIPLEKSHWEELYTAASDQQLWQFIPIDCSVREKFDTAYQLALTEREKGNQYPFVIYHKPTGKIIGSTRLFEIYPNDRKLEIGWTWIVKDHWATTVNYECKLLLLTFCFETLKAVRVQLKTRDTNVRSQKAIKKIGAKLEGVLRKDRIQDDGTSRNAMYFSIIDDEWEEAKSNLITRLKEKQGKVGI